MPESLQTTLSNGYIAITSLDNADIQIKDTKNNSVVKTFTAGEYISAMIGLPNNNILVSYPFPHDNFQIYNTENGNCIKQFSQGSCGVDAMLLLPDGKHIIAGGADKTDEMRICNIETGIIEKQYSQHGYGVSAIHLLSNDTIAVGSCSKTGVIRIINLESGALLKDIRQVSSVPSITQLIPQIYAISDFGLKLRSGYACFWPSIQNQNFVQKNALRPNSIYRP